MKMKKRFSEKEIVETLQEQQRTGKTISEICREKGIAENTFYIWKRKYGNMSVTEVTKLKSLEDENAKLKRLVADLSLENMVQKDVIKNFCSPE
jgi:putative transposase